MKTCFFVTDLHGREESYKKLFEKIGEEKPEAVFLGGDLLPSGLSLRSKSARQSVDFFNDFLIQGFLNLKNKLCKDYPRVFLILGNDDGKSEEGKFIKAGENGIWEYVHNKKVKFKEFTIYGYAYVPPSPYQLKDWERYDVSRYIDPGCVSPEEGWHTIPVKKNEIKYATIANDLQKFVGNDDLSKAIFLFHTPPYQSKLDRAALDGKLIDYAPLDVHVGSVAVKQFIEERQPLITLHGHIHESTRITGSWKDRIGKSHAFSAAHDGLELALVQFNPEKPEDAFRQLT